MRPTFTPDKHIFKAVLSGLLIGLLGMAAVLAVSPLRASAAGETYHPASLQQQPTAAPEDTQNPATPTAMLKDCQECHPDIGDAWTASPHAQAYSDPEFISRWQSAGKPGECLVCHTTNYEATTGMVAAEGVTCAACHGESQPDHPPAAAAVRSASEYCGACHPITHAEWRLTGHATAGVGCTSCHNPHSQKARFENPDEMCLNCHAEDLGSHPDDLHLQKGIGCVDCHALTLPPSEPPVDGLKPTGHTFAISATTCVACHTDTIKAGRALPGYEAGAKAVAAGTPVTTTLTTLVSEYTGRGAGPLPAACRPRSRFRCSKLLWPAPAYPLCFKGGSSAWCWAARQPFLWREIAPGGKKRHSPRNPERIERIS